MQTLKFLNDNNLTDLEEVRKVFYKKRITVSYNDDKGSKSSRVIFTCSKTLRNYTFDTIGQECNGLILEKFQLNENKEVSETGKEEVKEEESKFGWRPLVIPPRSPKSNVNTNKINDWLNENLFEVYSMEDGTVINLYYYNSKWIISTARGIEMNDISFNTLTYQQMLEECLDKAGIKQFYEQLDTNKCYTLGFKHPDIHPFREGNQNDIYKVWSIQSVEMGSEQDMDYSPSRDSFFKELPVQKKLSFKTKNMHNLYKRLASALQDYLDGKRPNYGYILVSKNPSITEEFSVLMLESSLMNAIRNLWYNGAYIQFSKARDYNKQKIILLNSFLDETRAEVFLELFPEYKEEFENLINLEANMIKDIHAYINDNNDINDNNLKDSTPEYAKLLANEVKNTLSLDLHDEPEQKIKDIVHTNKYIDFYYTMLESS